MNFRPQKKAELELNLTPMIDVVFLLLIFFMVTTTFDEKSELKISLPEIQTAQPKQQSVEVVLSIKPDGSYYVNQIPVGVGDLNALASTLLSAAQQQRTPKLMIHADAKTPHQAVMTALEAASRARISNVGFAATVTGEQ
jgi:biopolymer transport protein ExbD